MSTFEDHKLRGFLFENTTTGDVEAVFDHPEMMSLFPDVSKDEVRYDGTREYYDTYLDGYFGRPLVPDDSCRLRRLNKKERSRIEASMKRRHRT